MWFNNINPIMTYVFQSSLDATSMSQQSAEDINHNLHIRKSSSITILYINLSGNSLTGTVVDGHEDALSSLLRHNHSDNGVGACGGSLAAVQDQGDIASRLKRVM